LQRISKRDWNLPQYVLGENTSLFMPMQ
jgi:hypothetical protein